MPAPLRSNPHYQRLYLANLLSAFGTQATVVGLPLLVLSEFHHAYYLGLIGLTEALTAITAFPFAGLIIDRVALRTVLLVCDLGRALAVGVIALLLTIGQLSIGALLALTVVIIALGVPFQPAVLVALRVVVPAEQLPTALTLAQTRAGVAGVIGPLAGGALFALSPLAPLLVDATSFAASSMLLLTLRLRSATVPTPPQGRSLAILLRDLGAGVVHLITDQSARYLSIMVIVVDFAVAGVFLSLVATMSAGADSIGTGALFAVASGGNLVGSILVLPLLRLLGSRRAVLTLLSVLVVLLLALSFAPDTQWRIVLIGCCCIPTPLFSIVAQRTLLLGTPAPVAGRVQVSFGLLPKVVVPLGPLISTGLLSYFDLATVVRIFATVLLGFVVASSMGRMARTVPEQMSDDSTEPVTGSSRSTVIEVKDG